MTSGEDLEAGLERLEAAAARLREPGLDAEAAAALVEECARLATDVAAELDRRLRAAADASPQ